MRLILNNNFGGVVSVLVNESIMTHGFTSWSVSVIISSVNDYRKPVLNRVGSLSLAKITTRTTQNIHQEYFSA